MISKHEFIKKKFEQNLKEDAINLFDVLIKSPDDKNSILTIEEWVGSRCLKAYKEKVLAESPVFSPADILVIEKSFKKMRLKANINGI